MRRLNADCVTKRSFADCEKFCVSARLKKSSSHLSSKLDLPIPTVQTPTAWIAPSLTIQAIVASALPCSRENLTVIEKFRPFQICPPVETFAPRVTASLTSPSNPPDLNSIEQNETGITFVSTRVQVLMSKAHRTTKVATHL